MLILFVDDDRDDYEIFCEALNALHGDVDCLHAIDGREALRMMNQMETLPSHIFLDINMPVMDGKQCITLIKAEPRYSDIPVYVYSTSSNATEIRSYKALGAMDFIVKPSSFFDLVKILETKIF